MTLFEREFIFHIDETKSKRGMDKGMGEPWWEPWSFDFSTRSSDTEAPAVGFIAAHLPAMSTPRHKGPMWNTASESLEEF